MSDPVTAFRVAERALFAHHGFDASERSFSFRGGMMRALDVGDGVPTLFVHGGGGCAAMWAPLVEALRGRRSILVDRPGFGLSASQDLRAVDFRQHATEVLSATLDAFSLPAVDVIANSMGGLWSLWLALDRPERVRSLTLIGAPAFTGGGSAPLPLRLLGRPGLGRAMMALEGASPAQVDTLWRRMGHEPKALSPAMHALTLALERLPTYGPAWRGLLARITRLGGPKDDCVLRDDELARIAVPTAVVWGSHDPFGGTEMGQSIARTLRGSFAIAGRGHLPWLDDPRGCAASVLPVALSQVA